MEYLGTVFHQIDNKGRVRIPSKFLSDEERDVPVKYCFMSGSQGCISVYREQALSARLQGLKETPDNSAAIVMAKRKISGSVELVETDRQSRVVIPPALRKYAKIDRDIVTIGLFDHFEIWAKEVYDRMNEEMSFESAYAQVGFF